MKCSLKLHSICRYKQAGQDDPLVLYVDCGCCTMKEEGTKLKARFNGWPELIIRLDIWHYMRRMALGCTTDAHQLYPLYMNRLSACIFEWDASDLALLRHAKAQQLQSQGLPTDDVDRYIHIHTYVHTYIRTYVHTYYQLASFYCHSLY